MSQLLRLKGIDYWQFLRIKEQNLSVLVISFYIQRDYQFTYSQLQLLYLRCILISSLFDLNQFATTTLLQSTHLLKLKTQTNEQSALNFIIDMQIDQQQLRDNIRFVWNVTPSTRVQQAKAVFHPALHYTPLGGQIAKPLNYSPLVCKCQANFNLFCPINFANKSITCCICGQSVALPPNYANYIAPDKMPYQLMPNVSTFEFQSSQNNTPHSYAYCFVVDLCISEKQLNSIQEELIKVINILPDNARVSLITFNKFVHVYEFASRINTIYCINGAKEYKTKNIMELMGINIGSDPRMITQDIPKRFLVSVKEYKERIISRIKDLKTDPFIYVNQRPLRVTGQALNVAMAMAEVSPILPRIAMLLGGPCTGGPGQVISQNYKNQMRSAKQMSQGQNMEHFEKAKKFYQSLIPKSLSKKIIIDIFAFCVQQIGILQMSELLSASGGLLVMHQQFRDRIFKESFQKYFSEHQPISQTEQQEDNRMIMSTQGTLFVYASKDVQINGAIGQCYSLDKPKPFVADKAIGKGKTHAWYLGSIDKQKTITILYQTKTQKAQKQNFFIQFKTVYKNPEGKYITRITTVKRLWGQNVQQIAYGFDQQAAAVYLARMSMHKAIIQQQLNLKQWVDSSLCRWASYFANYQKNDQNSFSLPPAMKQMPQLVYHLRRSHFVNRFGCSVDQSYYHMSLLGRENTTNCISMIQPILLKYTLNEEEPIPVPLDEEQMQEEVILLLDSYFNVIEWYGPNVQSWYENKYHQDEEYQYIADFLQCPKQDVSYIKQNRFPAPNYYLVHPGHSKQRFLKSKVNPKKSMDMQNQNTITDDSDIKAFTEHLIKVVVRESAT